MTDRENCAKNLGRVYVKFLAGVNGNRTHQGRDTPLTGFEDREHHQATTYSLNLTLTNFTKLTEE